MSKVKELQERLLCSIGDYKFCETKYALDTYVVKIIDLLIAAVREEEHGKPTDVEQAGLDSIRYAIWAAYLKALYELLATGMRKADATAIMGELPKFYGDALPIREPPCKS